MSNQNPESNQTDKNQSNNTNHSSGMTPKRIAAIICIIVLAGMYLATLIVALVDRSGSGRLFYICMISTAVLPMLLWIYIWLYGKMTSKHTIADFDIGKTGTNKANDSDRSKEN